MSDLPAIPAKDVWARGKRWLALVAAGGITLGNVGDGKLVVKIDPVLSEKVTGFLTLPDTIEAQHADHIRAIEETIIAHLPATPENESDPWSVVAEMASEQAMLRKEIARLTDELSEANGYAQRLKVNYGEKPVQKPTL